MPRIQGVLVVDEIFVSGILLICLLNCLAHTGQAFVVIGDDLQFGPVCSTWYGVETSPEDLLASSLYHELAGGQEVRLSKCRRSDAQLFELVMNPPSLPELRRKLVFFEGADVSLCVSHGYRERFIYEAMKVKDKSECIRFPGDKRWPLSQTIWVAVGDRLLATKTCGALLNGAFVTVVELSRTHVTVRDDETGERSAVQAPRFAEHFLSAIAVSYQVTQAKTIRGTVALHQTDHKHFTGIHPRVGLSRATSIRDVCIA